MFGRFPYEAEPDGAVFGPHHFYLGVLLVLLACWVVSDGDDRRPWFVAGLSVFAVFSFALTWPYYPEFGALCVLAALALATVPAVLRPLWWRTGLTVQAGLLAGLFVAWDDALSHALGWRTPLDSVWNDHLHSFVSDPQVPPGIRLPPDLEALLVEQVRHAVGVVPL
ncbi:hypothetical protein [Halorussus marinus]|uniref:hypothetical protein n=1 Tax=Halorussus marinus TaxID=2505976 RepID=UPI001B2FE76E|nr:hypothetical protein [Halorussus marinus]